MTNTKPRYPKTELAIAKQKQCKLLADLDKHERKVYDLTDKVCENEKYIRSLVATINWQNRKTKKK